jgi:hypothetical protein
MTAFNDENMCYADFVAVNEATSPETIQRVLQGNWKVETDYRTNEEIAIPTSRAVGLQDVYYKGGDRFTIEIHGPPKFKRDVKHVLETKVFPHVNLKFEFVEQDGNCVIDNKWAGGGVAFNGGERNPTVKLSNSSQFLIIHEFAHALGMLHEMQNPNVDLQWIIPALEMKYSSGNINIYSQIINPVNTKQIKALPFDQNSVMIYPLPANTNVQNVQMKPADEFTDYDKKWLEMTYGKKVES